MSPRKRVKTSVPDLDPARSYRLRETVLCNNGKTDAGSVTVKMLDDPSTDTNCIVWTFTDRRGHEEYTVSIDFLPHKGIDVYVSVPGKWLRRESFDMRELVNKILESPEADNDR